MALKTLPGLQVRLLADRSEGEHTRVRRYDPETGQPFLADPVTGVPKPWPLKGVGIEGELLTEARVPTSWVNRGYSEGWILIEGERIVNRPSGPAHDPWLTSSHTFRHLDRIILVTPDGEDNIAYRVTRQPDKYAEYEGADDYTPVTDENYAAGETRVDWFYDLELDS